MDESNYYGVNFWYNELEKHGDTQEYGVDYYAYKIFNRLILRLSDIPNGYIVVMGTHNCVSFDLLCSVFGYDRCIGFDIANPTNHPCVRVGNIMSVNDNIPIAFVHNDIGNFSFTPYAKLYAQQWAAKNVVPGGYFLGRNNLNSAKLPLETLMERYGFLNTNLLSMTGLVDLTTIDHSVIEGHMLSKKTGFREWHQ